jgi:transketolase
MGSRPELVNALRALAMDAVQQANSGHPGMPMGMAEIGEVLWNRHLRHNPANPHWFDRDRFVLSNGHGSMLLYALLHLTGYDLPLAELKRFRQLHSKTPGHPEYGLTPGVETTTGPLGQGIANAVGMTLAEKLLAAKFNQPGHAIVDHRTYVFLGDGCLMEGISHEACSLAGTLGLGKLTAFYDDNGISIDGEVKGWFTDDTPKRFAAYGWHVVPNVDGHDSAAVESALRVAWDVKDRPTLICCKTVIGKGAPNKQGTADTHGAALGEKEVAAARQNLGWQHAPFEIPEAIYAGWDQRARGGAAQAEWDARFAAYAAAHPELAREYTRRMKGELPTDFETDLAAAVDAAHVQGGNRCHAQGVAAGADQARAKVAGADRRLGRSHGQRVHELARKQRGHARSRRQHHKFRACANSRWRPSRAASRCTAASSPRPARSLRFPDYSRNALRMAALMKLRNIFVFTHDSIGLGEDGPTHQSIEHTASLRLIPGMTVWRPCDTVETTVAWGAALRHKDGPTCLVLTRQNIAFQKRDAQQIKNIERGGYVLAEPAGGKPQAVIIATGSEVPLAMAALTQLQQEGIGVRVVSMPCTSLFDAQDPAYRAAVLPPAVPRVAVEAGVTDFWRKYVGAVDSKSGAVVGIDRFGESAPAGDLFKFFGFTAENVVKGGEKRFVRGLRRAGAGAVRRGDRVFLEFSAFRPLR